MEKDLPSRGSIRVLTALETGLISVQQEDGRGNRHAITLRPQDVPLVVKWLEEAASALGSNEKDRRRRLSIAQSSALHKLH